MQQSKKICPLIYAQGLSCSNKHKSTLICTTENCKQNAFMCSDQNCQCFKSKHFKCNLNILNFLFTSIQQHRKQMTAESKEAYESILKIYDKMIDQLSQDRQKFVEMAESYGFGENMILLINLIKQGKTDEVTGDIAFKAKSEIGNVNSKLQFQSVDSILSKWQKQQKKFQQVQHLFEGYRFTTASFNLTSNLINRENEQKIRNFFNRKVKNFELIFRASQHNYKAKAFHQKCDGVANTLTIAQTQFGKIIGGFTPLQWKSATSSAQKDITKQSFLFSLNLNEKFQIKEDAYAIEQDKNSGPVFGLYEGSRDLGILDNCNTSNCWTNFPSAYNNGRYMKSQQSFTAFCGNPQGKLFKIKDYQVYIVH